jgi:HTH-type transcriptional regulator/antitoxin HigA
MELKLIKTAEDYKQALARLEEIFDALPNTKEGDELEIISILIEKYEEKHYKIEFPDPIEAIKSRMEQMGISQTELSSIVGLKSRASEILNRKRKLTLEMIRKINDALKIPLEVLVQPY